MPKDKQIRKKTGNPPKGWSKFSWLGAAVLWALSSVGAGVIFYSPRVAAHYGYTLLWAIVVVIFFTWLITREIGRYTIVSGKTIMDGYQNVPGPRNWPIWIFLLTHLVDISLFTAGQAALAANLAIMLAPGSQFLWTTILISVSAAIIVFGGFDVVNNTSSWLAIALLIAGLVMLIRVFPPWGKLWQGFIPQLPKNVDLYFLIPWIGFLLVHGAPWFSYWVDKQGFGRGKQKSQSKDDKGDQGNASRKKSPNQGQDKSRDGKSRDKKLHAWVGLMSQVEGAGTILAGLFAFIFYILGAQLLGNVQVAPGIGIGQQMANQFKGALGHIGLWVYVITAGIAFWTTVLDGQDGATRMITDLTQILTQTGEFAKKQEPTQGDSSRRLSAKKEPQNRADNPVLASTVGEQDGHSRGFINRFLSNKKLLRNTYVIVLGAIGPIILLFFYNHPLQILSISGIIGAGITPIFTFLTLWLNKNLLPKNMQPSWPSFWGTIIAGLFFTVTTLLYLLHLVGINLLP